MDDQLPGQSDMRAIITFQGFTESEGSPTGTESLYWRVIRDFDVDDVTALTPRRWNSDIDSIVGMLIRQQIRC